MKDKWLLLVPPPLPLMCVLTPGTLHSSAFPTCPVKLCWDSIPKNMYVQQAVFLEALQLPAPASFLRYPLRAHGTHISTFRSPTAVWYQAWSCHRYSTFTQGHRGSQRAGFNTRESLGKWTFRAFSGYESEPRRAPLKAAVGSKEMKWREQCARSKRWT